MSEGTPDKIAAESLDADYATANGQRQLKNDIRKIYNLLARGIGAQYIEGDLLEILTDRGNVAQVFPDRIDHETTVQKVARIYTGMVYPINVTKFEWPISQTPVTTNYSVTTTDYVVLASAGGGAITMELPVASSYNKRVFHVKKIDSTANVVTVSGSDNIDTSTSVDLALQDEVLSVHSNGTQWWVVP